MAKAETRRMPQPHTNRDLSFASSIRIDLESPDCPYDSSSDHAIPKLSQSTWKDELTERMQDDAIYLGYCEVDDEVMPDLADWIVCNPIQHLSLLYSPNAQLLIEALSKSAAHSSEEAKDQNTRKSLEVTVKAIGRGSSWEDIIRFLEQNKYIRKLCLRERKLTTEDCEKLRDTQSKSLNLTRIQVDTVILDYCQIEDEGVPGLVSWLILNKKHLSMVGCRNARTILNATYVLLQVQKGEHVNHGDSEATGAKDLSFHSFDLSHVRMDPKDLQDVGRIVKLSNGMVELNLTNCGLNDECVLNLRKMSETKTIEKLHLSSNGHITPEGMKDVVGMVNGNSVKQLYLAGLYLEDSHLRELENCGDSELEYLCLDRNYNIQPETVVAVARKIASLKKISLIECEFSYEEEKDMQRKLSPIDIAFTLDQ